MSVKISASLLAANFADLGSAVVKADQAGVDAFHFDMMDGHYVPNIAFSPQHLIDLRKYTKIPFQLHLELGNPDQVLDTFSDLQAESIFVQWDTIPDPLATFNKIRTRKSLVGLSLNPQDKIDVITPFLSEIDYLLLLSVNPGFGGQPMDTNIYSRLKEAKGIIQENGLKIPVLTDGGIKPENIRSLSDAGADWLIIGTSLFSAANMKDYICQARN